MTSRCARAALREVGTVKFAVFTASTPDWSPTEATQILAAQGWDGIEWRITDQADADEPGFWAGNRATWPLSGLEESVPSIAAITRDAGLSFSGLGGYARCDNHEDVERMLAATAALGAARVRVTMPRTDSGEYSALFAAARADLSWIASRAAAHGVQALIELHHETITASASAARRLVDGLDPARVGVIHDLGNLVIEGFEEGGLDILGPYLAHVHVKNVRWVPLAAGEDGVVAWHHEWATLRAGQADVFGYLASLVRHGYDGWITVEDFSTELPLEERTADNLAFLRAALSAARA
jgi:sugar phosphate isomerase/epimerase